MHRFELAFSILSVIAAVCSALRYVAIRPKSIALDLSEDYEPLEGGDDSRRDPFDILQYEDTIDGIPVGAEAFWKRMRMVKLLV